MVNFSRLGGILILSACTLAAGPGSALGQADPFTVFLQSRQFVPGPGLTAAFVNYATTPVSDSIFLVSDWILNQF